MSVRHLKKYLDDFLPFLKISFATDGEILLYNESEFIYFEIGFYGDEKYSWFAKIDEKEYFEDNKPICGQVSDVFINVIDEIIKG